MDDASNRLPDSRNPCEIIASALLPHLLQLYYELYEQEKERYEKELREYSARDMVAYSEDSIPVPAREGVIPSHSLQMKKERD